MFIRNAPPVDNPAGVITGNFEDHHITNKYDGIAMNPPFGTGGKLAMDHLAKAFGHLKEGGRIVAIVPTREMDKRLNDFLTATTTNARGVTTLNHPDARFVTYIALPASTFGRARTGVMTRVVIIDRVKGGNDGTGEPRDSFPSKAARHEYDINQLFDYIKDYDVAPRQTVSPIDVDTSPGVSMHAHGRVVADAGAATFKVVGGKLETDAPVEQYTTQTGKVLDGVFWKVDKETAKSVDKFTFRTTGKPGYFIRMRDVMRPKDGRPAYSMAAGEVPPAKQMSVADLAAIVKDHVEKFAKPIPVHILDDARTLHLIEAIDPTDGIARGATENGRVFLLGAGQLDLAKCINLSFQGFATPICCRLGTGRAKRQLHGLCALREYARQTGKLRGIIVMDNAARPLYGEPTMCSKALADGQALGAANQTGMGAAVSKADADKIITRVVAGVGGRIPSVTYSVFQFLHDLSSAVIKDATAPKAGKTGTVYGTYRHGIGYVVLDSREPAE